MCTVNLNLESNLSIRIVTLIVIN